MTTKTKDKYDEAVEYLTEHPEEILQAWYLPSGAPEPDHIGHCLFGIVATHESIGSHCGCLTQIAACGHYPEAETPELTKAIRADMRIPKKGSLVTVEDLPVFAEWQRRIDKELGRV